MEVSGRVSGSVCKGEAALKRDEEEGKADIMVPNSAACSALGPDTNVIRAAR